MKSKIQNALMGAVDIAVGLVPRPVPPIDRLERCRVISHRGAYDVASGIFENTLPAFDRAVRAGAWGLEFDVRWTKDDVPVIHHDTHAKRTFKSPTVISELTFEKLRARLPQIPTLEEVIGGFGGRAHLMIEIKRERAGLTAERIQRLETLLKGLRPIEDYHLISLQPKLLLQCEFAPKKAMLTVAELNVGQMSRLALKENLGGVTGQYFLMNDEIVRKHLAAGQVVGTGFIRSSSVLRRELGRGVDLIFTNHAPELVRIHAQEKKLATKLLGGPERPQPSRQGM